MSAARQTPPAPAGSPAPAAGDGQGGAAARKNKTRAHNRALDHFLTATGMISAGDRASAVTELNKAIRIAGPELRAELETLLAQVERNLAAEVAQ